VVYFFWRSQKTKKKGTLDVPADAAAVNF